jgi:hypothetical protein
MLSQGGKNKAKGGGGGKGEPISPANNATDFKQGGLSGAFSGNNAPLGQDLNVKESFKVNGEGGLSRKLQNGYAPSTGSSSMGSSQGSSTNERLNNIKHYNEMNRL